MTQLMACGCGASFQNGDAFCGNCGRPLPVSTLAGRPVAYGLAPEPPRRGAPPFTGPTPLAGPSPATPQPPMPRAHSRGKRARESEQRQHWDTGFFRHPVAPAGRAPERMSNATRYLCAAAYLDSSFANPVIGELVGSHRAVVPSRGVDLIPVIRHCLKARKMQLVRDLLLSILLVLGLFLATGPLILILIIALFLSFLPKPQWERRSLGGKAVIAVAGVGATAIIAAIAGIFLLLYLTSKAGDSGGGLSRPGLALLPGVALTAGAVPIGLIYACAVGGTLVYYCYIRNKTLGEWLSPEAQAPPFDRSSERVEKRLAEINAAQYGNLTLYSGEDPFLGSGETPFKWRKADERIGANERAWSISIELNREGAPRNPLGPAPRGRVRIDPVELHTALRKRLLELNDPGLPPNERICALTVDDHVAGEGHFRWDSPLVDTAKQIPYSQVSGEAVTALIRNPQARLRYYQRVSISDEGQTVLAKNQPVIGSVDQEVVVSAFVYVAVEGHMFYLQFVPTSLAPIGDYYHTIDYLPKTSSGKFLAKVVLDTARTSFRDLFGAFPRLFRTLAMMRRERKSFNKELTLSADYVHADIGARMSVRQFGARLWPRTYIQQLDVSKYTQIIERLVLETVLDFLVAKGVDTTAYRASAQAIYNSGIIVGGDVRNSGLHIN